MIRRWSIRILLLLSACALIFSGLLDFTDYWSFKRHGRTTTAVPATKVEKRGARITIQGVDKYEFLLKFKTEEGTEVTIEPYVPASLADRLEKDRQIEIVYLADNPRRFVFAGEEIAKGYGWLAAGLAMLVIFTLNEIALRQRRRRAS